MRRRHNIRWTDSVKESSVYRSVNDQSFWKSLSYIIIINVIDRTALWYTIVVARLLYAQCWKQEKIPEIGDWVQKMIHLVEMDKMTKKIKDQDSESF